MSNRPAIIAIVVVLIVIILFLVIAYSYYPSSYNYCDDKCAVDPCAAQKAASMRSKANLTPSPERDCQKPGQAWRKWHSNYDESQKASC
jgi:hypothetical protein